MFAKKQIRAAGLIVTGIAATTAFHLNAQTQTTAQTPLVTTQAGPLIGYGTTQNQQFAQGLSPFQLSNQQVTGAQIAPIQYGVPQYATAQNAQYGYQLAAPVAVSGYAANGVQSGYPVNAANNAATSGLASGSVSSGVYQVAAPSTAYGYAMQQPAYVVGYAQPTAQYGYAQYGYAQPAAQYGYAQYQYAQPAVRYSYAQYAQPAVRYGYVQQIGQQQIAQQATAGSAAYYQSYSAAIRPTLPAPTVITKTIKTNATPSTTTTQTASYGSVNAVPYNECVAGCEEACSQNKSFLSHCVRACSDLVKEVSQNQSYAVDWKNAGAQAGRAVIAANTGQ